MAEATRTTGTVFNVGQLTFRSDVAALRAAAALTTSYVASSHVDCRWTKTICLLFTSIWASATSVEYYVEWSDDGTTWYRSLSASTSSGVVTMTENSATIAVSASLNFADAFPVQAQYMRVWAKRTGGASGDTLAIDVTLMTE